jgi:CubicO group peptidase (beta-lactamase class C family)
MTSETGLKGAGVVDKNRAEELPEEWEDEIRSMLERARVPGASISLIRPEGVSELMFGTLDVRTRAPVLRTSGFQLCSVSKAYVGTLGAALQHAGILKLDDLVCPIVPEYAPEPAWLRGEITLRDLLGHRLGIGKGGLSYFGLSAEPERVEVARRMSYVPRVAPFRGHYTYSNQAFTLAVLAFERVTGKSFADLLEEYVLGPAGMTQTSMGPGARAAKDRAFAHTINRQNELQAFDVEDDWKRPGSGGIMSTAVDQQLWLQLNIGRGQLDGKQILPASLWDEIWHPHVFLRPKQRHMTTGDVEVPFTAYGLGWWVTTYNGRYMVAHAGGGIGWRTYSSMLPDQGVGVSVLVNLDCKVGAAVLHRLLERSLDMPARPWFDIVHDDWERIRADRAALDADFPPSSEPSLPAERIAGRYSNAESGPVEVVASGSGLDIRFLDGPIYNGELQPLGGAHYGHEIHGPFATYEGPTTPQYRVRFEESDGAVTRLIHSYIGSFEKC